MKRKIIPLLITVFIAVLIVLPFAVHAATTNEMTIASAQTSVKRGEEIVFTVDLSGNDAYKSCGIMLAYDEAVFELVSGECTVGDGVSSLKKFMLQEKAGVFACNDPQMPAGTVFRFTLRVKEDAQLGMTSVSGTPSMKNGSQTVPVQLTGAEILIECNHRYENYIFNDDATCTTDGTETAVCVLCAETNTRTKTGSKLGHSFVHYVYNNDATCSADGTETAVCERCTATDTRKKSGTKIPHVYNSEWTSITAGHYHKCQNCAFPSEVAAHIPGAPATETTPQTCTVCGYIITPAIGHVHSLEKVPAKDATCTEPGNSEYYACSGCSDWFSDETGLVQITDKDSVIIASKGHQIVVDAAVDATCTEDGLTEGSHCSVCGTVIVPQTTVHATGHTTVDDEAVAATCTTEGKTAGTHCSVCDSVLVPQETIPATGHSFGEWKIKIAATEEIEGEKVRTCSACGISETEKIAKLIPSYPEEPKGNSVWLYVTIAALVTVAVIIIVAVISKKRRS